MTTRRRKTAAAKAALRPKECKYVLRLYVTGANVRSRRAILNIKAMQGDFALEVIDIYQKPAVAKDKQIVAAPTLIRQLPLPLRRIVGDLSNLDGTMLRLGLAPKT
jgi:circadian clock protein KaiB